MYVPTYTLAGFDLTTHMNDSNSPLYYVHHQGPKTLICSRYYRYIKTRLHRKMTPYRWESSIVYLQWQESVTLYYWRIRPHGPQHFVRGLTKDHYKVGQAAKSCPAKLYVNKALVGCRAKWIIFVPILIGTCLPTYILNEKHFGWRVTILVYVKYYNFFQRIASIHTFLSSSLVLCDLTKWKLFQNKNHHPLSLVGCDFT
jgi:hypothetical protein